MNSAYEKVPKMTDLGQTFENVRSSSGTLKLKSNYPFPVMGELEVLGVNIKVEEIIKEEPEDHLNAVNSHNVLPVLETIKYEHMMNEQMPVIQNDPQIAVKEEIVSEDELDPPFAVNVEEQEYEDEEETSSNIQMKTEVSSRDRARNCEESSSVVLGGRVLEVSRTTYGCRKILFDNGRNVPVDKLYRCPYCKVTFSSDAFKESHEAKCAADREAHVATLKRRPRGGKVSCQVCGKRFGYPYLLKNHMVVHSEEKQFKCDLCDFAANLEYKVTRHRKEHFIKPKSKLYTCNECGISYKTPAAFEKHILKHNPEELQKPKSIFCRLCGEELHSKGKAISHRMSAHPGNPYACEICGATFSMRFYVTVHKRVLHKPGGTIHESLLPLFASTQDYSRFSWNNENNSQTP